MVITYMRVLRNAVAFVAAALLSLQGYAAVVHPLDPLSEDEILGAAFTLLGAGAAQPGAIFQSIDLREPPKATVLAFQPGAPVTPRSATVYFRQNKKSYRTVVEPHRWDVHARPELDPAKSDGQLGLTITEVSDFHFRFRGSCVLAALAKRGLTSPDQLANVFVTPLTSGSFGLPEESRRIVKAQMYYRENAANQSLRQADRGHAGDHGPR